MYIVHEDIIINDLINENLDVIWRKFTPNYNKPSIGWTGRKLVKFKSKNDILIPLHSDLWLDVVTVNEK